MPGRELRSAARSLDRVSQGTTVGADVQDQLHAALAVERSPLSAADKAQLIQDVSDDILGYGPIDRLLKDSDVTEVMVNGRPGLRGAQRHGDGTALFDCVEDGAGQLVGGVGGGGTGTLRAHHHPRLVGLVEEQDRLLVALIAGYARRVTGEADREHTLALDRLGRLADANLLLHSLHRWARSPWGEVGTDVTYGGEMVVIGLTGGIGSGKSAVSSRLAARGAVVIDADAIVRDLQAPGRPVLAAMVDRFGEAIVSPDGALDRQAVADVVFNDPDALADLNAIVHPAVGVEIGCRLEEHAGTDDVVVLDVPLLVESGRSDLAALVVVDVDPEIAVARLVEHRGLRAEDARARMARQVSRQDRLARADHVIDNTGDLAALDAEVARAWTWIESLPHS